MGWRKGPGLREAQREWTGGGFAWGWRRFFADSRRGSRFPVGNWSGRPAVGLRRQLLNKNRMPDTGTGPIRPEHRMCSGLRGPCVSAWNAAPHPVSGILFLLSSCTAAQCRTPGPISHREPGAAPGVRKKPPPTPGKTAARPLPQHLPQPLLWLRPGGGEGASVRSYKGQRFRFSCVLWEKGHYMPVIVRTLCPSVTDHIYCYSSFEFNLIFMV